MAVEEKAKGRVRAANPGPSPEPTPEPEPTPIPGEPAPEPPPAEPEPAAPPAGADDPESAGRPTSPAAVVVCPNCAQAITLTADVEGYIPSQSPHYRTCPECDGYGQVSTGSYVAAHAVADCPTCGGTGFVDTETGRPITAPPAEQPPWQGATWDAERGIWV